MTDVVEALPGRWGRYRGPLGAVDVHVPLEFDAVGNFLVAEQYEHPETFSLALDLVPPRSVVLDLGAHLGTFSLAAAQLGHRVIAVEASPRNARSLEASAKRNGFDTLEVVNVAVSDAPGTVHFLEEGPWGRVVSGPALGLCEVEAQTVPELLRRLGVDRVGLVKMDVEGSEPAALAGMRPMLEGPGGPLLLFEANWLTLQQFGAAPADLLRALGEVGYESLAVDRVEQRRLVRVRADGFQPQTTMDYLAGNPVPSLPGHWRVRTAFDDDDCAALVAYEARHTYRNHRQAIAAALASAPVSLRARPDVRAVLDALTVDPDYRVAAAAAWWARQRTASCSKATDDLDPVVGTIGAFRELGLGLRDRVGRIADRWANIDERLALSDRPAR